MAVQYTYQSPLTQRTSGPGLILILSDCYPDTKLRTKTLHLDPPPVQKWAEEGFCVLAITIPDQTNVENWSGLVVQGLVVQGLVELKARPEREGERFGLIVYESKLSNEMAHSMDIPSEIRSMVVYLDRSHIHPASVVACPQLRHISTFGLDVSQPLAQGAPDQANTPKNSVGSISTYEYVRSTIGLESRSSESSFSFIHPLSPSYNHTYATLAHTRTLTFLRTHIGRPIFDIEAIWEAHTRFEFEDRNVEGTMGTMVAEPYVNHIPTLTGGIGRTALTSFYRHHFIHSNPASTRMELVSRTIGPDRIVDEFIFEFIHDTEMDWMLPGVPPTGKNVRVPFVAVVNVRGDKLYHEHIYWDQASVLTQIGLLPAHLAFPGSSEEIKLPVVGVGQAEKIMDPGALESNLLI